MEPTLRDTCERLTARPMAPQDHSAVLALMANDRLPGQPPPHPRSLLRLATADLDYMSVQVVTEHDGRVVGAVCCAVRTSDDAGIICWLHGGEDFGILAALIALARADLGPRRPLFAGTTGHHPADPQLPGVPAHRREVTAHALQTARFVPGSSYRFFQHSLRYPPGPPPPPGAEIFTLEDPSWKRMQVTDDSGTILASALLHAADPYHILLRHLEFDSNRRGRRMASHLLIHCLNYAANRGARSVITYLDVDNQEGASLLFTSGFMQHDTLVSYRSIS